MLKFICVGIAYALLVLSDPAAALAQNSDPGPPPDFADEVPTLEDAKSAIIEFSERYGRARCDINTSPHIISLNTNEDETKVSIEGGNIVVQIKNKTEKVFKKGFTDKDTSIMKKTIPLSGVVIRKGGGAGTSSDCQYPSAINFICKDGSGKANMCIASEYRSVIVSDGVSVYDHRAREPSVYQSDVATFFCKLKISDDQIADRLLKALLFYQANLPARKTAF